MSRFSSITHGAPSGAPSRVVGAALTALLATLSLAGSAGAQDHARTITLSPSRAEGVIEKGQRLGPFGVRNTTADAFTMRVFPALLGQRRDGSYFVRTEAADVAAARRYLRSDLRRFPFRPETFRQVLGSIRRVPRQGSLYAALLFQARPVPNEDGRPQITQVFQIAASLFLDPPEERQNVRLGSEAVRAEEAGDGPITLLAPVRNDGNVRVRARGRVHVLDRGGKRVASRSVKSFDVLPGAVVDLPAPLDAKLPAGDYTMRAELSADGKRVLGAGSMKLFADGRLASRQAALESFDPPRAHTGEKVEVKAAFRNTGNVPYAPEAVVEVRPLSGASRAAVARRVPINTKPAEPGKTAELKTELELPGGARSYELTVRLLDGKRELDARSVSVTPTAKPSIGSQAKGWVTENALVLVAALLFALVGGAAAVVRYVRHLKAQAVSASLHGHSVGARNGAVPARIPEPVTPTASNEERGTEAGGESV